MMRFCNEHWTTLREMIDARGLGHLVARDGQGAAENIKAELEAGEQTIASYDPLMAAYWALGSNSMQMIAGAGYNPLALMQPGGPECVICWMDETHTRDCHDPDCKLDPDGAFEWMLRRAADDQVERWRELSAAQ